MDQDEPQNERRSNRDAEASNPAGLRVNPLRWWWHYPKWPTIWSLLFALSVWAVVKLSLLFFIPLAFFTWANRLYWTSLIRKFAQGDANPGIVVAVQPTLIAVFTDLTTGRGNFPAVKISQCPLRRISGQKPQIGLRLATTAVYYGDFNKESWSDFCPVAIETGSGNRQANAEVLARFAEEDWQKLAAALDEVPSLEPGLHRLNSPDYTP